MHQLVIKNFVNRRMHGTNVKKTSVLVFNFLQTCCINQKYVSSGGGLGTGEILRNAIPTAHRPRRNDSFNFVLCVLHSLG